MRNKIFIHNLTISTVIGVPDWERAIKQNLFLDIEITLNDSTIFDKDNLENTIDYAAVVGVIKDLSVNHSFKLLESFGESIISKLNNRFSFKSIYLKIAKNKILPDAEFVGVILER